MNTQEREQLNQFLNKLVEVKLTEKDSEAENLIKEAISRQSDAAYLLIQRCFIQDQALSTAQAQIADLQRQLQQNNATPSNKSFLNENPWAPASVNSKVPDASSYQLPSTPEPNNSANVRPALQNPASGFGSSFLGNVATTAAGVVAGSFLFQGIENLLGHHSSSFTGGQQPNDEQMTEQTTINNYYGDPDEHANNNDAYQASYDDDSIIDDSVLDSDWV